MPCGCLFDMTLFEMTVISKSSFEMTLVSKSQKSSEWLSHRDDAGLSIRYDRAIFFHACGVFRLSGAWYNGTASVQSVSNTVQSAEKITAMSDSLFDMTKDYCFEMTRRVWLSFLNDTRLPWTVNQSAGAKFFCPEIFVLKSNRAVSVSWRKRSEVWLSLSRRKRSKTWLYAATVENLAIRDYGRKFVYASRDENGEYVGENDG